LFDAIDDVRGWSLEQNPQIRKLADQVERAYKEYEWHFLNDKGPEAEKARSDFEKSKANGLRNAPTSKRDFASLYLDYLFDKMLLEEQQKLQ